jgi:hypothetical protein
MAVRDSYRNTHIDKGRVHSGESDRTTGHYLRERIIRTGRQPLSLASRPTEPVAGLSAKDNLTTACGSPVVQMSQEYHLHPGCDTSAAI